jgi:putative spermidine/putrescine transport system substrate-binding protein
VALRRTRQVVAVAAGLLAAACGASGRAETTQATPRTAAGAATPTTPGVSTTPTGSATPSASASVGPGEGAVRVIAINGYVEWGGTDPKVNWVAPFEKKTGCKVSLSYYDPRQEMRPGGSTPASFDVISASPEVAGRLIGEGKVARLNTSLIHDYGKVPKRLRELPAYTQEGRVFGLPYLWGVNEVLYDTAKVRPKDAGELFDHKGPVLLKDSPLSIADAALVLKHRGEDIKNPFDLTPGQLDDAIALLSKGKSDERAYWRDPIEVVQRFATGSVRLAQGTSYQLDVLQRGHKPVAAVTRGDVTGWADSWMVSSEAPHPACAYQWLSWVGSAGVQKTASWWTGLAPANPAACTGETSRICADYHVGRADEFTGVHFAVRPADYAQWVERWSLVTHD